MSNTETLPKVDLRSFLDLQKKYLHGTKDKGYDEQLKFDIEQLQAELDILSNVYGDSNITNADLLTKQREVHHILNEEKKRLEKQHSIIEHDYVVKQRETQFNDSYRLRQVEVNKLLAIIVLGLFLLIVIILVNRHFGFIPESVITITIIVIISLVGIYSVRQLFKILLRSHMDFTKLELDEPEELKKQSEEIDSSDLLAANEIEYCVGPACCHEGTNFDNDQLKCIPEEEVTEETTAETFQNLQPSMCNSPYEEMNYAKI